MTLLALLIGSHWLLDLFQWRWCDPCVLGAVVWGWHRGNWLAGLPLLAGLALAADLLHWTPLGVQGVPLLAIALLLRTLKNTLHLRRGFSQALLSVGVTVVILLGLQAWRGLMPPFHRYSAAALHGILGLSVAMMWLRIREGTRL